MSNHKRFVSIATYEKRHDVLPDAISSLYNQGDIILVVYNGYPNDSIEKIVKPFKRVHLIYKFNDTADCSKFYYSILQPDANDVIFLCDDDLIFAPDFCDQMERCLFALKGKHLIALGGKTIKPGFENDPAPDFATCFSERHRVWNAVPAPKMVDVPISCGCVYQAGSLPNIEIDIKYKYAADVFLYKLCKQNGVSVLLYWGNKPLVTYNPKMAERETIWSTHTSPHSLQVGQLVQEIYKL